MVFKTNNPKYCPFFVQWLLMFWLTNMLCKGCKKVKPKSVIRPFSVFFYNCLQSFGFYKLSFACF